MKRFVLLLAACGHPPSPNVAPDFRAVRVTAMSPRGQLYADCLADAVANRRFGHAQDKTTSVLLFTCTAKPAQTFFDELGPWSAKVGSEVRVDGKTLRSTNRVRRDLFGVDYCTSDGAKYECVITLNAGDFVR